jgi:hypothetical protein
MKYKLTYHAQLNKRGYDKKCKSYLIYFLNDFQILKQKLPFDTDYSLGWQHQTEFKDVFLLNGRLHQSRIKGIKSRKVSFPVSKNRLHELGVPMGLKIELTD